MAAIEYLDKCSKCGATCHHKSGVCKTCRDKAKQPKK